jgi:hypothetical protein
VVRIFDFFVQSDGFLFTNVLVPEKTFFVNLIDLNEIVMISSDLDKSTILKRTMLAI